MPAITHGLLEAPRYCCADAARLVGLSSGQVRRYLRGYTYKRIHGDGTVAVRRRPPVTRPNRPGSDEQFASFLDVVDLLVVRHLLHLNFPLQQIRAFVEDVWAWTDSTHVANERFYTLDASAFINAPRSGGIMQELGTDGQLSLFGEFQMDGLDLEFEAGSGLASRWFPKGGNRMVIVDPRFSFGRPVLESPHISTDAIYDLYLGEGEDAAAVARWYDIDQSKVEAAVEYQRRLAA